MLASENLGGVLLNSQPNFSWLTAGGLNGIDQSREPGSCALLIRDDGKRFILANRIEMPRLLAEELDAEDFEPIEFPWEDEKATPDFLADRAQTLLRENGRLGSDTPLSKKASMIEHLLAPCRYQLTEPEIERFRSLAHDASLAIGSMIRTIKPGERELDIARQAADALGSFEINAIVNLVAADERLQKYRHPIPTRNIWKNVLMIVVCARRQGLIASLTRLVSASTVTSELQRRIGAVARVNAELMAATRPGTTGAQLYNVAARAYAEAGFAGEERRHHQGGACGYRTRDWVAHPRCQDVVRSNQAFAWNPSVSGAKTEETCIAFDEGVEVISRSPDWPQISIELAGREYLSPDVLSL